MTNQTNEEPQIVDKRASSRMSGDGDAKGQRPEPQGTPESGTPGETPSSPGLEAALAAERERAEQFQKNWQRSAADFINYKRRIESERGEQARFAGAALVINILPIFDDLDRAVSTVDASLAGLNWVQGVVAIHRKFALLLEAMDVHEIEAADKPFDPALHEAVARGPGPDGTVVAVAQKGYRLGERVIRPAMVIVGNGQN
ncbi:MAG: nucleotide exchange factor GrpE [Dehalococcoidia bacterium]